MKEIITHTHTSRATSNVGVVGVGVIDVELQFLLVYFSLIIQVFYLN